MVVHACLSADLINSLAYREVVAHAIPVTVNTIEKKSFGENETKGEKTFSLSVKMVI
jgi:hypothetical protein